MALGLELTNIYLWAIIGLFWACDKTSLEIGRCIGHLEYERAIDLLEQQQEELDEANNNKDK